MKLASTLPFSFYQDHCRLLPFLNLFIPLYTLDLGSVSHLTLFKLSLFSFPSYDMHSSALAHKSLLQQQGTVVLSYSPDLDPCDFYLFPWIKYWLKNCHSQDAHTSIKSFFQKSNPGINWNLVYFNSLQIILSASILRTILIQHYKAVMCL
jgi:hypothetical protein